MRVVGDMNVVESPERIEAVNADPDDDKFMDCAAAGSAEYLVTRDEHLPALDGYRGLKILPPAEFLALLKRTD